MARMTNKQLRAFLAKNALSQRGAAKLIGISARQMYRYTAGELPVPLVVELALRWVAAEASKRRDSVDPYCAQRRHPRVAKIL
jgi:hypothetical protein